MRGRRGLLRRAERAGRGGARPEERAAPRVGPRGRRGRRRPRGSFERRRSGATSRRRIGERLRRAERRRRVDQGRHDRRGCLPRPRGDVVVVIVIVAVVDDRGRIERGLVEHVAVQIAEERQLAAPGLRSRDRFGLCVRALAPRERRRWRPDRGRLSRPSSRRRHARSGPPRVGRAVRGGRRSSGARGRCGRWPSRPAEVQGRRLPRAHPGLLALTGVAGRLGHRDRPHAREARSRDRGAPLRGRSRDGRPGDRGGARPGGRCAGLRRRGPRAIGREGRRRLPRRRCRRALRDDRVELARAERRDPHQRAHLVVVLVVRRVLVVEREQRAHHGIGVPFLESAPERGGVRRARGAIALERIVEDPLEIVVAHVEDGERRRRGARDPLPRLGVAPAAEGARPGQHLVERRRDGPDVVAGRERPASDALGRLVGDAARRLAQVGQDRLRGAIDRCREHALRRDGAVRDAEGVKRLDPLRKTNGPADGVELVHRAIAQDPSCKRFHLRNQGSTGPPKFVPGSARRSSPGRPIPGSAPRRVRSEAAPLTDGAGARIRGAGSRARHDRSPPAASVGTMRTRRTRRPATSIATSV